MEATTPAPLSVATQVGNGDVRGQVQLAVTRTFGANEWPKVEYIIENESGFNPYAVNPSSGACGIGQALPCSKMSCALSNVPCQINWLMGYFQSHYNGSIEAAYSQKLATGWY